MTDVYHLSGYCLNAAFSSLEEEPDINENYNLKVFVLLNPNSASHFLLFQEEVKNEINIMNQLNHVNLIQLYDAFECKNNLTLIME